MSVLEEQEIPISVSSVQSHLQKVLESQHFKTSKRLCSFLTYTVERALRNDVANVKERTLGIEVFSRAIDYDTDVDPIVRVTAATVRKRLSKFYEENLSEPVTIEYCRGSYVPRFHSAPIPVADIVHRVPSGEAIPAFVETAPKDIPQSRNTFWPRLLSSRGWITAAVSLTVIALCALSFRHWISSLTPTEAFWEPLLRTKSTVWLSLPDYIPVGEVSVPVKLTEGVPDDPFANRDHVSYADAYTLMFVTHMLGKAAVPFRVFQAPAMTLDDVRQGPGVVVGSLHNPWTEHFLGSLRYRVAPDGPNRYILDGRHPDNKQWSDADRKTTYGILSRYQSPLTGQPIVLISGTTRIGTAAAARCLSDERCFAEAYSKSPGDWKKGDIQIVVQATVVDGVPSQPRVVATDHIL